MMEKKIIHIFVEITVNTFMVISSKSKSLPDLTRLFIYVVKTAAAASPFSMENVLVNVGSCFLFKLLL